jgi:hypothetical protein
VTAPGDPSILLERKEREVSKGCRKSPTNGKQLGWFPSMGGQKEIHPRLCLSQEKGRGIFQSLSLFLGVKVRAEKTL